MKKLTTTFILLTVLTACVEPETLEETADGSDNIHTSGGLVTNTASAGIAAKNFTQINLTYSNLTGVPTYTESVLEEYKAIELQLPSSTDPVSLNGFNQLSSTRLAFAYCDVYMDKPDVMAQYPTSDAVTNAKTIINSFADLDFEKNTIHQTFLNEVVAILGNKGVDGEGNDVQLLQTNNKNRLLKLGCAAVLSSSYLTLI